MRVSIYTSLLRLRELKSCNVSKWVYKIPITLESAPPRQLSQSYGYLSFLSLSLSFLDVAGRGFAYIKMAQAEMILTAANCVLHRKGITYIWLGWLDWVKALVWTPRWRSLALVKCSVSIMNSKLFLCTSVILHQCWSNPLPPLPCGWSFFCRFIFMAILGSKYIIHNFFSASKVLSL